MQQMALNLLNVIAPPVSPAVFTPGQAAGMPPVAEGFPQLLARLGGGNAQNGGLSDVMSALPGSGDTDGADVSVEDMTGFALAEGLDTGQLASQLQTADGLQGVLNAVAPVLQGIESVTAPVIQQTGTAMPVLAQAGDALAASQAGQAANAQAASGSRSSAEGQDMAAGFPRSVGVAMQAFFTAGGNKAELMTSGELANSGQQIARPAGLALAAGAETGLKPVAASISGAAGQTSLTAAEMQPVALTGATVQGGMDAVADDGMMTAPTAKQVQAETLEVTTSLQLPDADAQGRPISPASPEAVPRTARPDDGLAATLRTSQSAVPAADPRMAGFQATGERPSARQATSEGGTRPAGDASAGGQSVSSAAPASAGVSGDGRQPADILSSRQAQISQTSFKPAGAADSPADTRVASAQTSESGGAPQQLQSAPQPQPQAQPQPVAGQATVAPQASAAPEPGGAQAGSSAPSSQPATPPSPAANMVGLSIARAVSDGQNRFTVRLDPPELGRVDIRLEMSGDGAVRAVIRADSQDTLDLLQRDARQLERALADSGLKTDSGSLNFSLNQQGQGGRSDGFGQPHGQASSDADDTGADGDPAMAQDAGSDDGQQSLRLSGLETDSIDITI